MSLNQKPTDAEVDFTEFDQPINTNSFGPKTAEMYDFLRGRVIGQDDALLSIARGFAVHNANLGDGRRPIATLLFTGPTGVGKTMAAEELSRYIISDEIFPPLINVDCTAYQEKHEIAKLIGSPPGYVGHDGPGLLSQLKIDEKDFWRKANEYLEKEFKGSPSKKKMAELMPQLYKDLGPYYSVILFDEIEKSSDALHKMLLGIVDKGELLMNDGSPTHFNNSIIVLTSNVGGREQQNTIDGKGGSVGFKVASQHRETDEVIIEKTMEGLKDEFSPEFLGRLRSGIVVFKMLGRETCAQILDNMLVEVQNRLLKQTKKGIPVVLHFSTDFKESMLDSEDVRHYGARPLRDMVKAQVTLRLSNAVESGEIRQCDEVLFDLDHEGRTVLRRKARPKAIKCRALTTLIEDPDEGVPIVRVPDELNGSGSESGSK